MTNNPRPSSATVEAATWTKSSYSAPNNECVELSAFPSWIAVRDSKHTGGPALFFGSRAFAALLTDVINRTV